MASKLLRDGSEGEDGKGDFSLFFSWDTERRNKTLLSQ